MAVILENENRGAWKPERMCHSHVSEAPRDPFTKRRTIMPFKPIPRWIFLLALVGVITGGTSPARAQNTGAIAGVVVDGETGDPLPGANVAIAGTTTGTSTDLNGRYRIRGLTPGTHDVVFSFIGFQQKTVTGVEVETGTMTELDVTLVPETEQLDEVIVSAEAARDSEAGLLRQRQKAAAFSNAISAEAMSRSGSSTAADAMEKVTGASVVDGKYINVRGLGGRYISTELNGANLPSPDPDRNSVPLDLFPSALLDNVVVTKTFTPDQSGSFTGGNLDITTKSFPEELAVSFSSSMSVNSEVRLGDDMLYLGGGASEVPAILKDEDNIPSLISARTDEALAQQLNAASRALTSSFAPSLRQAPVNQGYDGSFGGQFAVLGRPLGIVSSITYDRSVSGYQHGTTGRYSLSGDVSTKERLDTDLQLSDASGTLETLYGGLMSLSYQLHPEHELGLNVVYNRSDETQARLQSGQLPRDLNADQVFETRTLRQTYRTLGSVQGRGEHVLGGSRRGVRLEWKTSYARTEQDEPDLRFFTNHYTPGTDTTYYIRASSYPVPTRYFRNQEEATWTNNASVSVPFDFVAGRTATFKFGGSYLRKDRTFRERIFQYRQDVARYEGSVDTFFGEQLGIVSRDDFGRYRFGNYIVDATERRNNYDGEQELAAGFVMLDAQVLPRLRVLGGVRYETTLQRVTLVMSDDRAGEIRERDWLPSLNLIYNLTDAMNVRTAYGRTLARPTFREFSPVSSFSFVGDYTLLGNADLKRTLIDNVDLRWEWFPRAGELIAVSAFHKRFTNPIERTVVPVAQNPEFQYRNVDEATVLGLEVEARKRLDFIAEPLQYFQAGMNLTLVDSDVSIAPSELEQIRAYDPHAEGVRELQGQSPYVVNVDLSFDHPEWGTAVDVFYNVFGRRLDTVVGKGAPNFFEEERATVDVMAAQALPYGLRLKASVKNVFGAEYRVSQRFKGQDFVNQAYPIGRSISIGLQYTM